jgi:hypothetical protein
LRVNVKCVKKRNGVKDIPKFEVAEDDGLNVDFWARFRHVEGIMRATYSRNKPDEETP